MLVDIAMLVAVGTWEVRPPVIPQGRSLELAFGAVRGVLADPSVRRIFAIFGTAFLAQQIARPYVPVLVERSNGPIGEASAIGLVAGTAALAVALSAPAGRACAARVS